MKKIIALILILLLLPCAFAETQLYAVNVGKGDAILIQTDGHAVLIDTGYLHSRGKILAALRHLGITELDAVFITHTDTDHTEGLEWLAESEIPVGTWYASAYFTDVKEKKHPAVQAAKARGQEVTWLQAGDRVTLGSAVFNVLAPSQLSEDKDNNNSLVMMLESADGRILLTGDMELPEETILLNSGADLSCDVLKVANHADDDTTGEAFVRAANPKLSIISTDSYEKPSTPDPQVLARLQLVNTDFAFTQDSAGGVLVTLTNGSIAANGIDLPAANADIQIESVIPDDDKIVIANRGSENIDLSDWYLVTERKGNWFVFPEVTTLAAGETITLGSKSTSGEYDLLWEDKKVIHKSKADAVTLYDANGMTVSTLESEIEQ